MHFRLFSKPDSFHFHGSVRITHYFAPWLLLLSLISIVGICLPLPASAAGGAVYTIPFQYDPPLIPRILIRARIGNSRPLLFDFDTGTNVPILLRPWAAKEIALRKRASRHYTASLNEKTANFYDATLNVELIANPGESATVVRRTLTYCVMNIGDEAGVRWQSSPTLAGTIGLPLLLGETGHGRALQIDCTNHYLRLYTGERYSRASFGNVALRLRRSPIASGNFEVMGSGTDAKTNHSRSLWLLVDTGAYQIMLPSRMHDMTLHEISVSHHLSMGTVNSEAYATKETMVDVLTFPTATGTRLSNRNLAVDWTDRIRPDLGLEFLNRYQFTIDPDRHRLWLQHPSRTFTASPGFATFSVEKLEDGTFPLNLFRNVEPHTDSTIALTDKITAIDGKELHGLSENQAEDLLDGVANTVGCMQLYDTYSATYRTVWFQRLGLFGIRSSDLHGLKIMPHSIWLKAPHYALVVYANGTTRWLQYRGREPNAPPGIAPPHQHWQTQGVEKGRCLWTLVND